MRKKSEPAFPTVYADGETKDPGMGLRDYFAGQALAALIPALCSNADTVSYLNIEVAEDAYNLADSMLHAREHHHD